MSRTITHHHTHPERNPVRRYQIPVEAFMRSLLLLPFEDLIPPNRGVEHAIVWGLSLTRCTNSEKRENWGRHPTVLQIAKRWRLLRISFKLELSCFPFNWSIVVHRNTTSSASHSAWDKSEGSTQFTRHYVWCNIFHLYLNSDVFLCVSYLSSIPKSPMKSGVKQRWEYHLIKAIRQREPSVRSNGPDPVPGPFTNSARVFWVEQRGS